MIPSQGFYEVNNLSTRVKGTHSNFFKAYAWPFLREYNPRNKKFKKIKINFIIIPVISEVFNIQLNHAVCFIETYLFMADV